MARTKSKKTDEERKKQKKEAERRRRARIKADPAKNEQHKAKEKARRLKRKEEKKTKSVKDLTSREQRAQRKQWCESARRYRDNKKAKERFLDRLREDSPPSDSDQSRRSVQLPLDADGSSPVVVSGLASPQPSLSDRASSTTSVLSRQKIAGMKVQKKNQNLKDAIIQKQKATIELLKKKIHTLIVKNRRLQKTSPVCNVVVHKQTRYYKNKIAVQRFLEKDENSKLCPGKKDTITRYGRKKQKRYLCDNLQELHQKYNSESDNPISYTTFTRFRPFWIVAPKVTERDTCLCALHENFNLIFEKLRQLRMIKERSVNELCDSVVCNKTDYNCILKECEKCVNKVPNFEEFDNTEKIRYGQWLVKTEIRIIKGKAKNIKRTVKDLIECNKKELVEMLPKFLKHRFNIWHQYQAINKLKQELKPGDALIHIDFSENFQCKYASETQSVHFGASRQQLSLHTCVLYHCEVPGIIKTISFCSVSDCLRHDAAAIYAHLDKSLKSLQMNYEININRLHVLSDGPSTQYKNKTNFYLFTQHLTITLGITSATWNFSESGHGKGAADGVGAVVKRTADSLIAHGHDIPDFETFVTKIVDRTNIILFTVLESDIADAEKLIPKTLKPIPNTTKIHQITWCCNNPHKLYLRELSCTECLLTSLCSHYSLKKNVFDYNVSNSCIHIEEPCNQTGVNNKEIASIQITSNSSEITT